MPGKYFLLIILINNNCLGDTAIPHSWPWQAFVKIEGKAGGYDCGGSIIGHGLLTFQICGNC